MSAAIFRKSPMDLSKLIVVVVGLFALSGCISVETIRAKEPSYLSTYAGEYKPFSTCVVNKIIERQVPTVLFDDPNKTATISTWISDMYGRHLLNEATIIEVERGKLKVELHSMINKTVWGTVPEPVTQFIAAFDACGKVIS